MPSLGHLLLGGLLGLFLYYLSDKKFTKFHAFVLFMNCYMGPDVGWVTDLGWLSHNVFGFCFIALPLAAIYSYVTRFSPDFKHKELADLGQVRISYLNTYCLVVAGGTLHNYLDGVINGGGHFSLTPSWGTFPGISPTIADFQSLWVNGINGTSVIAMAVGIPLVMGFIYYYTGFLKHAPRMALFAIAAYIVVFMGCFYFLGSGMTGHNEAGAIAYVILFYGFPFGLITASVKIPVRKPKPKVLPAEAASVTFGAEAELPKSAKKKVRGVILGKIAIVFFFLIGAFLLLGGAGLLVFSSNLVEWAVGYDVFWVPYASALTSFLFLGGLFLIVGGLISFLAGVKLRKWDSPDFRLILFHAWLFASGFVAILIAIGAITLADPGAAFVFNNPDWGSIIAPYINQAQLAAVVQLAGILLGILGLINYFLGLGLLQRSERWRRLTFLYNICWAWAILGLIFACYLSQNDVRAQFQRSRDLSSV